MGIPRAGGILGMAIASILFASCERPPTAPLKDGIPSGRRTLRSSVDDNVQLVVMGGTHVLVGGKAMRLSPENALNLGALLDLQDQLDSIEKEFRPIWKQ